MKTVEIWLAQLDPTVRDEVHRTRHRVVISPGDMNAHLRTVLAAVKRLGALRPATLAATLQALQARFAP